MRYIVVAKHYHLGTLMNSYRQVYDSRQKALDKYVELMENDYWNVLNAEVYRERHISINETESFLFDANCRYLSA